MIVIRKHGVRIGYTFYDEPANAIHADILRQTQMSKPLPGVQCKPFHTMLIDLGEEEDALFNKIKKDTRNEIRRAGQKDGATAETIVGPSPEQIRAVADFYDQFAVTKGLDPIDRAEVNGWADAKNLVLTSAAVAGDVFVWHIYYVAPPSARLLYSASLFRNADSAYRNLVGRANRFLHWQDLLHFKAGGFTTYDFGGWYEGSTDLAKLQINKFKEEFGGHPVQFFNCERAVSLKGRLATWARQFRRKKISAVVSQNAPGEPAAPVTASPAKSEPSVAGPSAQ